MLKVGITGGIGSGKSTVAEVFRLLGIPVYFADEAAKNLMQDDENVRAAIKNLFGDEAYPDGKLDRRFISSYVFNNPAKLRELNAIVHPATIQAGKDWLGKQTTAYTLKEAAILFESGSNADLDKVIGVYSPEELRIQRVMKRDGVTMEKVKERMANQMNEDEKMALCDFVIKNDETELIIPQVIAIHKTLLKIAAD